MGKGVEFTWSGFSPDIQQKGPAHKVATPTAISSGLPMSRS